MDFVKEDNIRVEKALAKVFYANAPDYAEWSNIEDIVCILNSIVEGGNLNRAILMFGWDDIKSVTHAKERNCIELVTGSTNKVVPIEKLVYRKRFYKDLDLSYFWIQSKKKKPLYNESDEYMVESLAQFESGEYQPYEVFDNWDYYSENYDEEVKCPNPIRRQYGGRIILMSQNLDRILDNFVTKIPIEEQEFIELLDKILDKSINQYQSAMKKMASEVNKIQLLSNGGIKNDYATQIAKLEGDFRSLGLAQDTIATKTQNVKNSLATLKTEFAKPVDQQNFQAIQTANDNLQRELIESRNEYERLKASMKGMATEQQRLSLANTIEAWNQKNTAATREVVDENHRYIMSLRDLNTQMTKMDFGKISTGFKQNENYMRAMNRLGKSLKEQFTQAYQSFTMWLSASSLVMKVISETREAFTELKEVNTLLTEISKANENLNKQQLAKIADDGFDIASDYGKSVTHYLSGVQEASRAGYENAEAIAELSVAIQGAGDVTEDIANKYVIATDKAYGLKGSVEELTKVFDGSNYITNKNAVNMTELADGMSIVGSTAASFGIEVNETTAALGTMIASTQQSGSEMARAFRAILLNIRQVSDEEEGIDAEGLTKYEKACSALGVSLKETRNGVLQTRDAMEVLKELSVEYNKLEEGDLRRTQLLNSVGGKLCHVMQKCITRMNLIAGNPLEPCTTI